MNNDLISRSVLLDALRKESILHRQAFHIDTKALIQHEEEFSACMRVVCSAPSVDAEVVRHEGNTTFVTTDNLDAYADRIIVVQGNWCKVYYRDSDDAGVEG